MKKKKTAFFVVFAVLGIAALGLIATVYAKYVSTIQKTSSATVAKWAFSEDNLSGSVTCTPDSYNTDTVGSGLIAPGTSGKCPIVVSNEHTQVGISYDIKPSTTANQPKNLKFYSDAAHANEINSSTPIHGTLMPGATATTVYVYWNWPYEGSTDAYDEDDTNDGEAAATMTMTFDVTGTQVQPVAQ